jgi:alkylhydroperoxidase/carboxymuconolactone decarboxylase family protein YurZ
MSISNMKIGAAQLRTLVRGLLAAGATRDEITDIVASATSEVGEWQQLGDIAERVAESCSADIRDHQRKMQAELNRRREKGEKS